MEANGERNDNKKASKWTCKLCAFENLRKAKVCKKCNKDKETTADGPQLDEAQHDAADHISPNLEGTQNKGSYELPSILADVKAIINRMENEIKQPCEEAKSVIKSKQRHFKQIIQGKQHTIQQLDEVSRLLSKPKSDESSSSANQKSKGTILKQKRKGLMAERETQWVAREENLNEEFKKKRKQELTEIENQWTEKWKREMEEKWSTIESYMKEDLPEKDLDIRKKQFIDKFTSELKLKLEGMKILWETRNNIEWTAHRQIRKFQWDNESGQLWAVDKLNCIKGNADEVVSKDETSINTDSKQISKILEICKSEIETIFKSSKALMKTIERMPQNIEKYTNKEVEGCQELYNKMAAVSTITQQQDVDLKTLKNRLTKVRKEVENTKLTMNEEYTRNTDDWTRKLAESEQERDNLKCKNTDLTLKLKTAIDEQERIRKQFIDKQQGLQLKLKHEKESWESQRQQLIQKQSEMNQELAESKLKYETDSKEWQDQCKSLITSECQLNRPVEQLKQKSKRKDKIVSGLASYQIEPISIKAFNSKIDQQQNNSGKWRCYVCTFENFKNPNVCEICNNMKRTMTDVTKSDGLNKKVTILKPQIKQGVSAGIQGILTQRCESQQGSNEQTSTSKLESQENKTTIVYPNQTALLATYSTDSKPPLPETYLPETYPNKTTSTAMIPIDVQTFSLKTPNKHLSPDFKILVIGDCYSQSLSESSISIIINALASVLMSQQRLMIHQLLSSPLRLRKVKEERI